MSKALLPVLWKLYPDHRNLLPAFFADEKHDLTDYVVKPIHSREGANIKIVRNGRLVSDTGGTYHGPSIVQQYHPLSEFNKQFPVIGSWIIGDSAHGMGIRESENLVTNNMSRFVPHIIEPEQSAFDHFVKS